MTNSEKIQKITEILQKIKYNGHCNEISVFDSDSLGVLHYSSVDVKELTKLKNNLIALNKFEEITTTKTVIGTLLDNRLEKDKPKKPFLEYINLDTIFQ